MWVSIYKADSLASSLSQRVTGSAMKAAAPEEAVANWNKGPGEYVVTWREDRKLHVSVVKLTEHAPTVEVLRETS
jgi:hypothetical protein